MLKNGREVRVLALIPARGGSKGLPGKNTKMLCGKPLIAHTIEVAKASNIFSEIVVSTDSTEIAEIAKKHGASIPFMRPKALAGDSAKGIDVVEHAITWFEDHAEVFQYIMVLQPTSPLRNIIDIQESMRQCLEKNANAIVGFTECDHNPLLSNVLPSDNKIGNFVIKKYENLNRQEMPKYYRVNGAVYVAEWNYIRSTKSWLSDNSYAYIMPRERSLDIDNVTDFKLAELLMGERAI